MDSIFQNYIIMQQQIYTLYSIQADRLIQIELKI